MLRRTFVSSIAATGAYLAATTRLQAQSDPGTASPAAGAETTTATTPESGYAPVNGLQMYYEIHGSGEPLVLLHGAFATIDLWGPILTTLAAERQVIAVEFQAHGHTADIDRPFSYEQFADDVAGLMEHLGVPQADIVGYSLGANSGLQLAIRRPELVRKLVAISANFRHDAYYPEVYDVIETITPELFAGSPLEAAYLRNAPRPEDWPVLIERIKAFDATEFAWPAADMQAIAAPTLLITGDSDNVRPEHTIELFQLLGGGVPGDLTGLPKPRLAILPGITHVTIMFERTDTLLAMVEDFLEEPMPDAA